MEVQEIPLEKPLEDRPRLLVVDDEEAILFAMCDYLGRSGYGVVGARSGEEAQAYLDQGSWAAIIADLKLDVSDPRGGLELVHRARRRQPGIRILLLTAYGSPEVESELAALGGSLFLSKPVPLARLAEALWTLLEGPGRAREDNL